MVTWVAAGVAATALCAAAAIAMLRAPDEARPLTAAPVLAAPAAPAPKLPVAEAASEVLPYPRAPSSGPPRLPAAASLAPEPPRPSPRAGTERAFYEADLLLAARPGALDARARQLFAGDGSDLERVAVLRALWDTADPQAAAWFGTALRPAPDAPVPLGHVTVAEFALLFLQEHAAREPPALDLLAQLVRDAGAPLALRRGAGETAAALGDVPRLRELAADLASIPDPDFRAAVAAAADRNENAAEAARLFAPFAKAADEAAGGMAESR